MVSNFRTDKSLLAVNYVFTLSLIYSKRKSLKRERERERERERDLYLA